MDYNRIRSTNDMGGENYAEITSAYVNKMLRSLEEYKAFWIKIPLTTHSLFDTIYQVNSIFHEGVVSAKVWFVNILIIEIRIIWQILNNETHVYR